MPQEPVMTDLEKLKALAEGATPGPWTADKVEGDWAVAHSENGGCLAYIHPGEYDGKEADADASYIAAANPSVILSLIARLEASEAERVRLSGALEEIKALEPRPFVGGLDYEAIDACEECQRYKGHPIQQDICDTHRKPIYARERHNAFEESAIGPRAKLIAMNALSSPSEQGAA